MPRTAQKPAEDAEEMYLVTDTNARSKPRTHQMRERFVYPNGRVVLQPKDYTFHPGQATKVPYLTALKFARADPAFEVQTPDGQTVRPKVHTSESGAEFTLDIGQVVAQVDELTTAALKERAAALPGSEYLPAKPSRDDLIKFVLGGGEDPSEDLGEFERVAPPKAAPPRASVSDELQDLINAGEEV